MHLGIDVNAYSRKGSAAETDFVSTAKSLVILCPHECTATYSRIWIKMMFAAILNRSLQWCPCIVLMNCVHAAGGHTFANHIEGVDNARFEACKIPTYSFPNLVGPPMCFTFFVATAKLLSIMRTEMWFDRNNCIHTAPSKHYFNWMPKQWSV